MKLKLNFLPYFSFIPKKLNTNSIIFKIIKVFFIAILLSNSIYLSFFENIFTQTISPFLAIWGLVLLLKSKTSKQYFWIGFFVGILWFWWIGLSSIYFNLNYLVPIILIIIGFIYGLLFRLCYLLKFDFLRLCGIFCISFIHPLGFDWFNWGIFTVYGFFDPSYRGIICIFLIAYFIYEGYISRYYKIVIVLILFFSGFQYNEKQAQTLNLNYKLINTNISQDQKFLQENLKSNSDILIQDILQAINEKKELVILPETAFAFDLKNTKYELMLKELSYKITIITGAFHVEKEHTYNSTYIFKKGNVYILNKHFLVPFGEEIPFFKDLTKKYFLKNIEEFSKGPIQSKYKLDNQIITNAICYEATKEQNYQNSQIIIALSNNAWFNNSSEYKLQQLLMKFYASKYGVSVYHATNGKENIVILPKKLLSKDWKNLSKEIFNDKK
ncbi:apolipoprotein N-acyltransferase [Campylobacter jejuni]|uniref:apolipoprotein N-acyltransferase n=1 Tax=Campylobacter jejuni TaxID=197 RepID=UPI000C285F5A|nr:apolipoprotein N-acyltransferase [Campylobacter jejuni]EJM9160014.1 apolipoprotein N-acyltransferase [Campylobacter jejuni]EJY5526813.1 apolipoprotein N-acyltransferase [Campylobacter jejuni]EKE8963136.1 apolipoprotein N-acyltransferase [Campylobacter jejuni]PJQ76596.1 apolipoprotein N-acyltransferase [Campylobacter jejuni subsp. jejuni]HEC1269406.1 apolipoprotein N-acyltransferase [Campylobacter jejuni]